VARAAVFHGAWRALGGAWRYGGRLVGEALATG